MTLPEHFGDNLDALFDVITGELEMPLHLEFVNMSVEQLEIFEDLLTTLEDAEEEVEGFTFSYYLEQYEDEEDWSGDFWNLNKWKSREKLPEIFLLKYIWYEENLLFQ